MSLHSSKEYLKRCASENAENASVRTPARRCVSASIRFEENRKIALFTLKIMMFDDPRRGYQQIP
jgi:hypothetical protein